jgi:hypothetical protein
MFLKVQLLLQKFVSDLYLVYREVEYYFLIISLPPPSYRQFCELKAVIMGPPEDQLVTVMQMKGIM